jgi:iron complex transport system substrate-binding protein
MNRWIVILSVLVLCSCSHKPASSQALRGDQRALTDMAGRTVIVPRKITRVLGMGPVGTIFVYTLSPELLVGWNHQLEPAELTFIQEPYRHLPEIGGWYGKNNTGNLEEIVKAHPDVLISMGDPQGIAVADRVQHQIHIPVFFLSGDLKKLPDAYLKAGELLGNSARAAELATECRNTLQEIETRVSTVPLEKRRRVYYAEEPTGMETEPSTSIHSEALEFAGAANVAAVPGQQGYGHTPVSMEQILAWDPEVVISGYEHSGAPGEFYRAVWTNSVWRHVRAVTNHQVFEVPQYPFGWIDRPPSVNRIVGIRWIANLLYPNLFHDDMRAATRQFYARFYRWQLSDAELDKILATATRESP